MKNLILRWLFGTDKIKEYMQLLGESLKHHEECKKLIDDHLTTLNDSKEYLNTILNLIKICENHGIDVDKEIKDIK